MERISDERLREMIAVQEERAGIEVTLRTTDKPNTAMLHALRELAELRSQSRWVKVSPETMPPAPDFPYWCVVQPKSAEEAYRDTSGNPIMGRFAPYTDVVRTYKRTDGTIGFNCNGLSKVTMYFPLPAAPKEGENG